MDLGRFGWHDYNLHPARTLFADLLAGKLAPADYLARPPEAIVHADAFGLQAALAAGQPGTINWVVDRTKPGPWTDALPAGLEAGERMNRTDYRTFAPFIGLTAQFWRTGDPAYRTAALALLADFHRRHFRQFWADYARGLVTDASVAATYQADWRPNTNGLAEAARLNNVLRMLAVLAKCAGPDRPAEWKDVLAPRAADLPADGFDPADYPEIGAFFLGLISQYPQKLLWFSQGGAIANQKLEALTGLQFLARLFPEARPVAFYTRDIEDRLLHFLETSFLPDGGMIEQSLNYNLSSVENLERLIGLNPRLDPLIRFRLGEFRRLLEGLRDPLGRLPQIGNNPAAEAPAVWADDARRAAHFAKFPPPPDGASSLFPFSGYYALRTSADFTAGYLFFKNSRRQRGHLCHDNNGLQLVAFGRPLLVYGGPPSYGLGSGDLIRTVDTYLSEGSTLKTNTVLVDGLSQDDQQAVRHSAPQDPIFSAWYDGSDCSVVDGLYSGQYGGVGLPGARGTVRATHHRTVYLWKQPMLFLVVDQLTPPGDGSHRFTQIWKFPPKVTAGKTLEGFDDGEITLDPASRQILTRSPDGPNLQILQEAAVPVSYERHFGDVANRLGWFSPGIGAVVPAVDVHAHWAATGPITVLTWLVPAREGDGPRAERLPGTSGSGSAIRLADGTRAEIVCFDRPQDPWKTGSAATQSVKLTNADGSVTVLVNSARDGGEAPGVRRFVGSEGAWRAEGFHPPVDAPAIRRDPATGLFSSPGAEAWETYRLLDRTVLETFHDGQTTALSDREGLRAWFPAGRKFPNHELMLPALLPVPEPILEVPEPAVPGLLRKSRPLDVPRRAFDALWSTLSQPVVSAVVDSPVAPDEKNVGVTFETWMVIPAEDTYTFSLRGPAAGLSFGGPHGELLPPVLESQNGRSVSRRLTLKPGYYPIVISGQSPPNQRADIAFEVTPGPAGERPGFLAIPVAGVSDVPTPSP
jgi:hypothetical protein